MPGQRVRPRCAWLLLHAGLPLLAAGLAARRGSSADRAAGPRLAVAVTWVNEATPDGEEALAAAYCPLALVLARNREALRDAAQEPAGVRGPERLLLADGRKMGAADAEFLLRRGIRVVDISKDPTFWLVEKAMGDTGRPGIMNMAKLLAVNHTEYDALVHTDADMFLEPESFDYLGDLLRSGKRMFVHDAMWTPTNGGFYAVRPSEEMARSLEGALRHGFSYSAFWGGSYEPEQVELARNFSEKKCAGRLRDDAQGQVCCHLEPPSPWCFNAADRDQGMLLHLAIESSGEPVTAEGLFPYPAFPMAHYQLWPKPWETDQWRLIKSGSKCEKTDLCRSRTKSFWRKYGSFIKQHFHDDEQCTAFYAAREELYRTHLA